MDGDEIMTSGKTAATALRIALGALVAISCATLSSCRDSRSLRSLDLPSTPVITESDRFALVLDPYVALRDEPGPAGITVSHVRRGEVYAITGKRIIEEGKSHAVWVCLESGWCPVVSVELYSSRDKAETASARFDETAQ